jgi:hypothetical protein
MSVVSVVGVIVFAFLIALCRKQRRTHLGTLLNTVLTLAVVTDARGQQRARLRAIAIGVILAAVLADQAGVNLQARDMGVNDQAVDATNARGAVAIRAGVAGDLTQEHVGFGGVIAVLEWQSCSR